MKSSPRGLALTIGCQHSTGRRAGRGTSVTLFQLVAAVRHPGWHRVVRPVVGERALVERFEDQLDLLFVQRAIGVGIQHRRTEGLHLARVVAASEPEDDPAAGQIVGGGEILRQPQRVPHGRDVEATAELDALGQVGQMDRQQQDVGQALVAFALEVVLGQPEGVVTVPIQRAGDGGRLVECRQQPLVREPAGVDRRRVEANVVEIYVAGVQAAETGDHVLLPGGLWRVVMLRATARLYHQR